MTAVADRSPLLTSQVVREVRAWFERDASGEGLGILDREVMFAFLLDGRGRLLRFLPTSIGNATSCTLDADLIGSLAVEAGARGVVLAHNHPSGTTAPSSADVLATLAAKHALAERGVRIVDHVIVTYAGWSTFREVGYEGLLRPAPGSFVARPRARRRAVEAAAC